MFVVGDAQLVVCVYNFTGHLNIGVRRGGVAAGVIVHKNNGVGLKLPPVPA